MSSISTLGVVATWFIFGMARMVFTSRMVELRTDHPDPSEAMAFTWKAARQRVNAANYDSQGQRLLPWYRAVTTTYWIVVASACGVAYFG
jgi:hypothetical protein